MSVMKASAPPTVAPERFAGGAVEGHEHIARSDVDASSVATGCVPRAPPISVVHGAHPCSPSRCSASHGDEELVTGRIQQGCEPIPLSVWYIQTARRARRRPQVAQLERCRSIASGSSAAPPARWDEGTFELGRQRRTQRSTRRPSGTASPRRTDHRTRSRWERSPRTRAREGEHEDARRTQTRVIRVPRSLTGADSRGSHRAADHLHDLFLARTRSERGRLSTARRRRIELAKQTSRLRQQRGESRLTDAASSRSRRPAFGAVCAPTRAVARRTRARL